MIASALSVALAPLLIAQGRRLRRNIPQLPEPDGVRNGVCGMGPRLDLLVLGDSAAAGVGARSQALGLLGQTVAGLMTQFEVHFTLVARTGATAGATLEHLRAKPLGPAHAVLVSLGVNDATQARSTSAWLSTMLKLDALLLAQSGSSLVIYSGFPPVAKFPALPQPLRMSVGLHARKLDRVLEDFCNRAPHRGYLSFIEFGEFKPELTASDGFHPGEGAYAVWGAKAARRIALKFA